MYKLKVPYHAYFKYKHAYLNIVCKIKSIFGSIYVRITAFYRIEF